MAKSRRGRPKKLLSTKDVVVKTTREKQAEIIKSIVDALMFDAVPDMDDWADEYFQLPSETSHESGQWKTARFPFLRRPMKCLSPSSIASVIVSVKGSQLGFTTLMLLRALYNAHFRPGPHAYAQKTKEDVEYYSTQKLAPTIKANPCVERLLGDLKPTGYANSMTNKAYPGGFYMMGPANSTGFLKSKSLRDADLDEEDEYAMSIGDQGSPIKMLEHRLHNFPGSKLFRNSTPVHEEFSTIWPAWEGGSREEYYVPCPYCNPNANDWEYMFLIEWETIKWSKEKDPSSGYPVDAWCECPQCGGRIDEAKHKTWMLSKGDWFSTKNAEDPENELPRYRVGDVKKPSFRIPSFYSPFGFYSWLDAVNDWHEYLRTRDRHLLQVFINQVCARTFSLQGGDIDHAGLYSRRETYGGNLNACDVPARALCLTAGVDVQDDRIEVHVKGWGLYDESWTVDYKVLSGDTATMGNPYGVLDNGRPSVWRLLDEYLIKRFRHESGVMMPIEVTMIDCGYKTDEVHNFVRPRESRRIYAVRGKEGWGNGMWRRATRRHEKYKTIDYLAFVDEIKTKMYAYLAITDPGPGYWHFPKSPIIDEQFIRNLTCERKAAKTVRGQIRLSWENPSGKRNEGLDTSNYAYVAYSSYGVDLERRAKAGLGSLFGDMRQAPKKRQSLRRRGSPGL